MHGGCLSKLAVPHGRQSVQEDANALRGSPSSGGGAFRKAKRGSIHMTTAPVWAGRGRCKSEDEHKRKLIFDNCASVPKASSPTGVATISKSRSSLLLSELRKNRRLEIREAAAAIPGIPTSAGVMLDIEQLRALIEALQATEVAARRRGWLR
jgi:hypothetical protein